MFDNGPSIKDVPSQGEERFVQCGHLADKGVLQKQMPTLFGAKSSDFSKFMVCPHGQGGMSQCEQGGGGQFFGILCGRLLWTIPNTNLRSFTTLFAKRIFLYHEIN